MKTIDELAFSGSARASGHMVDSPHHKMLLTGERLLESSFDVRFSHSNFVRHDHHPSYELKTDRPDTDPEHLDFSSRIATFVLASRLLAYESTHVDDVKDLPPKFLKAGRSDVPTGVIPELNPLPVTGLSTPLVPEANRYYEKDTMAAVASEKIDQLSLSPSVEIQNQSIHLRHTLDSFVRDSKLRQSIEIMAVEAWHAATTRGVKDTAIAQVLSSVDDLIAADKNSVKREDRERLAAQILCHTAFPEHIDQGNHNTCALSTMEEQLFYFKPEEAAQIARSAVIEGAWVAPDGLKIQLDSGSLKPAREEFGLLPDDGKRSYASQLIQVTLVNESVQRRAEPEIYMQKHNDLKDTGEFRQFIDKNKKDQKLQYPDTPDLSDEDLALQHYRLFQNHEKYLIVNANANYKNSPPNDAFVVHDEDELGSLLTARKGANAFPLVMKVNASNPPFSQGYGVDSWHAVSITDYDPKRKIVFMCNQWGVDSDKAVPLSDLYQATCANDVLMLAPSLVFGHANNHTTTSQQRALPRF